MTSYRVRLIVDDDKGEAVLVVYDKVKEDLLGRLKARVARSHTGIVIRVEQLTTRDFLTRACRAICRPFAW